MGNTPPPSLEHSCKKGEDIVCAPRNRGINLKPIKLVGLTRREDRSGLTSGVPVVPPGALLGSYVGNG